MFYQDVLHLWHDIWNVLWKFKPGLHWGRHCKRSRNHGSVRALFKWLSKDWYKRNHLTNHNRSSQKNLVFLCFFVNLMLTRYTFRDEYTWRKMELEIESINLCIRNFQIFFKQKNKTQKVFNGVARDNWLFHCFSKCACVIPCTHQRVPYGTQDFNHGSEP